MTDEVVKFTDIDYIEMLIEIGWFIRFEINKNLKQNGTLTFQTRRLQFSIENKKFPNAEIPCNIDTHTHTINEMNDVFATNREDQ